MGVNSPPAPDGFPLGAITPSQFSPIEGEGLNAIALPRLAGEEPACYLTGENAAGTRSLFSWRTGRTPDCGGQLRPGAREASRTRPRSFTSL